MLDRRRILERHALFIFGIMHRLLQIFHGASTVLRHGCDGSKPHNRVAMLDPTDFEFVRQRIQNRPEALLFMTIRPHREGVAVNTQEILSVGDMPQDAFSVSIEEE